MDGEARRKALKAVYAWLGSTEKGEPTRHAEKIALFLEALMKNRWPQSECFADRNSVAQRISGLAWAKVQRLPSGSAAS